MISIVTGTLNRLHLLPDLIENTVLASDKVELVLVDGGSTDSTVEYIKEVNHPRIKLIEVGKRSSYPHYMNLGIKNASFDLICQWNDDVLLVDSWDEIIAELEDDVDVYLFNWKYGQKSDLKNENWLSGTHLLPEVGGWCVVNQKEENPISGIIVMNYGIYRKGIFNKIGMYDNKFNYYYADGDMSERSWHFGYKVKTLRDIRVMSLPTQKKAIHFSDDKAKSDFNIRLYKQRILPESLEYLTS